MYSFLLKKDIKEEILVPCYFFHGEETFLAQQFIDDLREVLVAPDGEEYNFERFSLEDHSWVEIIDVARTIPFFFSSWRIIVVDVPKERGSSISAGEENLLKDYFASPLAQTLIVIIFPEKINKNTSFFKFFSSFPADLVFMKELKPLKNKPLFAWVDRKLLSQKMAITPEAKRRLVELIGNNLQRLNNEVDKLVTFVGDKNMIELDDVDQISGLAKTFFEWEIADSLEKADIEKGLVVLNNLFRKESVRPEYVLGAIVKFFRDIVLAKLLLREKDVDRRRIFRELKPHISEKFGSFYATKFKEFFSLVERFTMSDLNYLLAELGKVDLRMKTSALNSQTLLEGFLFEYCNLRKN